jgi:hypothetical protein
MKTAIREALTYLISRMVDPSAMVQLHLARSAAFTEATRRALHERVRDASRGAA